MQLYLTKGTDVKLHVWWNKIALAKRHSAWIAFLKHLGMDAEVADTILKEDLLEAVQGLLLEDFVKPIDRES